MLCASNLIDRSLRVGRNGIYLLTMECELPLQGEFYNLLLLEVEEHHALALRTYSRSLALLVELGFAL